MKMDCVIYTKENCTWCVAAKEFLTNQRTSYEEIKIGEDITRDELLEKYPEAKTVPIIVIDNEWIGGYMELVEYFTSNGMMLA
jgi:glutaredoxin